MSDRVDARILAERLAEDTDRLLAGEEPREDYPPAMETQARVLRATVEKLARVFPARQPEADLRNRIRARLTAEWEAVGPGSYQDASGWRSAARKRRAVLGWAVLGVGVLLLAGLWIAPEMLPAQAGAAQFQTGAAVLGIVVLGIIALVLWWLKRKS